MSTLSALRGGRSYLNYPGAACSEVTLRAGFRGLRYQLLPGVTTNVRYRHYGSQDCHQVRLGTRALVSMRAFRTTTYREALRGRRVSPPIIRDYSDSQATCYGLQD